MKFFVALVTKCCKNLKNAKVSNAVNTNVARINDAKLSNSVNTVCKYNRSFVIVKTQCNILNKTISLKHILLKICHKSKSFSTHHYSSKYIYDQVYI